MSEDKTQTKGKGSEINDPLSGKILEQAEIDGLLKGANSDNRGLNALVHTTTVSYERLPMLEVIFDRLMALLSSSLRSFTSDNVDVNIEEITSMRFKDYLDNVKLPSMLNVIQLGKWDTQALLILDNPMIYSVVDIFLGGRREQGHDVTNRTYTAIEVALNEEFINVLLRNLSQAFEPVEKIDFFFVRAETNPRFVLIERPSNAGIVVRICIEMDDRGGHIEFFIPYSSIESVRDKLLQTFIGEKFGNDLIWENHLAHEVWQTTIQAEAVLDQVTLKLSDVLSWKVGSTLVLDTFEGANIILKCGECRLFSGKIGNVRKRVAIQVEKNFLKKGE